jgi:uncharacterized protein YggT (Ycf19 family)
MKSTNDAPLPDDIHRIEQHENMKDRLRKDVHQEIQESVDSRTPEEKSKVAAVADQMKSKAIGEIGRTEAELDRAKKFTLIGRVVDFLFYLAYSLIGMEIVLSMMGARSSSGFKQFLDTVTAPLLAPFRGLLFDPGVGPFRLMLSYIFALVFFLFLQFAIRRFLKLMAGSPAASGGSI